MEISILDEKETVKGLVSASAIEGFRLKSKILFLLDQAKQCVEKTNFREIRKVDTDSLGNGYLVRIRI